MNEGLEKIMLFILRWWKWVLAAVVLLAGLSASRRADIKLDKAKETIRDKDVEAIEDGWDDVDEHTSDFLSAQEKAKKANEKLNKALDKIARSEKSAAAIISDWNAANRLSE